MKCPICSAEAPEVSPNPYRPFCSSRCKQVDLGRWVTGAYAIPGPLADSEIPDGFGEFDLDGDDSGAPWGSRKEEN
jgi:endogenous inhibitor of DNA gyrase (YacG/DUF329 family)